MLMRFFLLFGVRSPAKHNFVWQLRPLGTCRVVPSTLPHGVHGGTRVVRSGPRSQRQPTTRHQRLGPLKWAALALSTDKPLESIPMRVGGSSALRYTCEAISCARRLRGASARRFDALHSEMFSASNHRLAR